MWLHTCNFLYNLHVPRTQLRKEKKITLVLIFELVPDIAWDFIIILHDPTWKLGLRAHKFLYKLYFKGAHALENRFLAMCLKPLIWISKKCAKNHIGESVHKTGWIKMPNFLWTPHSGAQGTLKEKHLNLRYWCTFSKATTAI